MEGRIYLQKKQHIQLWGFDINDRYNYFNINRDIERENFVYNKIIDFDGDYIFIADDPTRNFTIDNMKAKMSRNVKIIRSSNLLEYNIFDLLKSHRKCIRLAYDI